MLSSEIDRLMELTKTKAVDSLPTRIMTRGSYNNKLHILYCTDTGDITLQCHEANRSASITFAAVEGDSDSALVRAALQVLALAIENGSAR